jgi:hypothetical protein
MNLAIKRVGLVVLMTGAAMAAAASPAGAANRTLALTGDESASWTGGAAGAYLLYPVLGCESLTPADACDASLITVTPSNADQGPASLTVTMTPNDSLDDFDLSVYVDANGDGAPDGDAIASDNTGLGAGETETVTVPDASGTYLVEVPTFLAMGDFSATAALNSPDAPAARAARASRSAQLQAMQLETQRARLAAQR